MKSFNEWLDEKGLNEISYELAKKAGDIAYDRSVKGLGPEERAPKLWDMAKKRGLNVIFPVVIKRSKPDRSGRTISKILFQANTFKIIDQTKKGWFSKSKPTEIEIYGQDAEHKSLYDFVLRLNLVTGKLSFYHSVPNEIYEAFLDRSGVVKLVDAINKKSEEPFLDATLFSKHTLDLSKVRDPREKEEEEEPSWGDVG